MKLGLAPLYALSYRGIGLGGQAKPSGRTREHPAACDCAIASCVAHTSCVLCGAHSLSAGPAGQLGAPTLCLSRVFPCSPHPLLAPCRAPQGQWWGPVPARGFSRQLLLSLERGAVGAHWCAPPPPRLQRYSVLCLPD